MRFCPLVRASPGPTDQPFLAALANELRVLNVTTLYTAETRNLIGPVIGLGITVTGDLIQHRDRFDPAAHPRPPSRKESGGPRSPR
jgi:hypothetical protein